VVHIITASKYLHFIEDRIGGRIALFSTVIYLGLDDLDSFLCKDKNTSLGICVWIGSVAHPASSPTGTGGSSPGVKAAGT
jgi:hypothetical protein